MIATDFPARQDRILTFAQYADGERRHLADKYGVPLAEVTRLYPDSWWDRQWWAEHVLRGFDAGLPMNPRVWHALHPARQTRLLRTSRALRDDRLTHELLQTVRLP